MDHLETAIENGFAYAVVGAPLVIADGLIGNDYVTVEINQKHFREVKIASAAYHADALLVATHFKGHEMVGFGGTLKNIGMGLGSRSGKQMMHSDVLPVVRADKCIACGKCLKWCPGKAIRIADKASILPELCLGCGECVVMCPNHALGVNWKSEPNIIQEKICEFALGVLKDKPGKSGFISFVMNVSPDCDCPSWNDAPIVADIGILASRDPVALDQACLDMVNNSPVLHGSILDGRSHTGDKFKEIHGVDGTVLLAYAEFIGLGSRDYRLITV